MFVWGFFFYFGIILKNHFYKFTIKQIKNKTQIFSLNNELSTVSKEF